MTVRHQISKGFYSRFNRLGFIEKFYYQRQVDFGMQ